MICCRCEKNISKTYGTVTMVDEQDGEGSKPFCLACYNYNFGSHAVKKEPWKLYGWICSLCGASNSPFLEQCFCTHHNVHKE